MINYKNKVLMLSAVVLAGCNDDQVSIPDGGGSNNTPPVADITSSTSNALVGTPAFFLSTGTTDNEGDALTYSWNIESKPVSSLPTLNLVGHNLEVTFDKAGDYTIQLHVTDGEAASISKYTITAIEQTPPTTASEQVVAKSGNNQKASVGTEVILDGHESYDTLGNSLSYSWSLIQKPTTSTIQLSASDSVFPTFIPDVEGTYVAQLIVSANNITSTASTTTISVGNVNTPPMANAGHDISSAIFANNSNTITLDGSLSHDADGDKISYLWEIHDKPSGSSATLNNDHTPHPILTTDALGSYEVTLVVFDGISYSQVDSVKVEQLAHGTNANHAPIADAGNDLKGITAQTQVVLDGSASSDIDGDTLSYQWTIASQPAGSSVTLSNPNSSSPSFVPSLEGNYQFSLIVNDGSLDSLPDGVAVVVGNNIAVNHTPQVSLTNDATSTTPVGNVINLIATATDQDSTDTHTFQWSINAAPAGSSATLTGQTSSNSFTPDVVGTYTIQVLATDDKGAVSKPATNSIAITTLAPPVVVPPKHSIGYNSTIGGTAGAGAFFAIDEDELKTGNDITQANRTSFFELTGLTKLYRNSFQAFIYNEHDQQFYIQLEDSGLYGGGSIVRFDPSTDTLTVVAHLPRNFVNGHLVGSHAPQPAIHPSGKYLIANTRFGGAFDAGRVYMVNIDTSDAKYGEVNWIYDLGCGDDATGSISATGSNCSPSFSIGSDARAKIEWDVGADGVMGTSDDALELYSYGKVHSAPPSLPDSPGLIRLVPTDTTDLTKRWKYEDPNINFGLDYNAMSFSKHHRTYLGLTYEGTGTLFDNGAGGYVQFGCHHALGVTYDENLRKNVAFCQGNSHNEPALYTGSASSSMSIVRRYANIRTFLADNFSNTEYVGAFVNYNDEIADIIMDRKRLGFTIPPGLPYKPGELYMLNHATGADTLIMQGDSSTNSPLGTYFIGRATSDDHGKYVVQLSLDGGDRYDGAVLKYDRDTGIVTSTSFGFPTAGYLFGQPHKHSETGDIYTSAVVATEDNHNIGSHLKYNTSGVTAITGNGSIAPGIAFTEAGANKNIYSIGVNFHESDKPYSLYEIDRATNKHRLIFNGASYGERFSDMIVASESPTSNELRFAMGDKVTGQNLYCFDLTQAGNGYTPHFESISSTISHGTKSGSSDINRPHDFYRSFVELNGDWFFVANQNNGQAEPSIQKVDVCGLTPIEHVLDLTKQATTTPFNANNSVFIGTGDTLVEFDGTATTEHTLSIAGYTNLTTQGYLSELDGGLIAGVLIADDSNGAEKHFIFTFNPATLATTYSRLADDMPLDHHYPGVVEVQ